MGKQVVLISHGKLSAGVADAVSMVFGANEELSYLGLAPDGNVVELIGGLRDRVTADPEVQFIVIADIFGGSVCNQSLQQLSEFDNVVLLSGLSMGLVLSILAMPASFRRLRSTRLSPMRARAPRWSNSSRQTLPSIAARTISSKPTRSESKVLGKGVSNDYHGTRR